MVIAIHTISLFELETDQDFFYEIFSRIISTHPTDQFVFITNDNFNERFQGKNVSFIIPGVIPKNKLYAPIWHRNKLKTILKKTKPDLLIHTHLFTAKTDIPQFIFQPDVRFLYPHEAFKDIPHFSNKKVEKFLNKAQNIIVRNEKEKTILAQKFPSTEYKIQVILPGTNNNKLNLSFEERESLKERIAEGNEYFIYSGIISPQKNLVNLLKAFSAFKKRQRSGMQLIITGIAGKDYTSFSDSLKTYKYKEQIKILPGLTREEKEEIFAAAYSLIIPSGFDSSYENIFFAMQNSIPVLAAENGGAVELCGEAGIYFNSTDIKNMAEKMMFIFKDEDKRRELIELGKERIKMFDWNKSAGEVSNNILEKKI